MPQTTPGKRGSRYPGDLGKRIAFPRTPTEKAQKFDTLLFELFSHYRIDPKAGAAWRDLAHSLIFEHVPAFRGYRGKTLGAPKKSDARRRLLSEVIRIKAEKGLKGPKSDSAALQLLQAEWDARGGNPFSKDQRPRGRSNKDALKAELKNLRKSLKKARSELEAWTRAIVAALMAPTMSSPVVAKGLPNGLFGLPLGWTLPKDTG